MAMTTMIVVLTTSLRTGHETFFISALTSCQNWRMFVSQLGDLGASDCSFGSAIEADPSRVLGVAILLTSIAGAPTCFFIIIWQGYQDSNPDFRFWRPTC